MTLTKVGLLLLPLLLTLTACQPDQPSIATLQVQSTGVETTFERVRREGVVRVGFANENPYAYAEADGTLTGEAIEVARRIFTELGVPRMEGVLTQFGSLVPGLQAGRFDAITAGMFINSGRCRHILFADPEYTIGVGLITVAGNPLNLHSYEDIAANPAVRAGTGEGYLTYDFMLDAGISEVQIFTFLDDFSGIAGLRAGRIDAWTATTPTLIQLLDTIKDDRYEMVDPFRQPVVDGQTVASYGATAFRREDVDLRNAFNAELTKLKESGELLDILSQFEGFGAASLPGDVTVTDLCPDAYLGLNLN